MCVVIVYDKSMEKSKILMFVEVSVLKESDTYSEAKLPRRHSIFELLLA